MNTRYPVTADGVTIPKSWFGDANEVEIRRDNGQLVVVPLDPPAKGLNDGTSNVDDPIWQWGDNPVDLGVSDASSNVDKYLYDEPHGTES